MPLFSAFTCWGHLRYKRGPSRFRIIYQSMREGQGSTGNARTSAYGPNDVHQEARIYATARCLAIAEGQIARAANEERPGKTQQLLATNEKDYGLTPAPGATEAERRAALALKIRILRGSRKESLDDALTTLLGSGFVEAIPMKDLVSPPTPWPATPEDVGNYQAGADWRVFRLTECIALLGVRNVHFVDVIAGQAALKAGDVVVVGPTVPGTTEACAVSEVLAAPVTDANGVTTNYVKITAAKPHDAGTVCSTAPFPLLTSGQRHILIRVTAAVAESATLRAAINDLMRRMLRGVTTWEIQVDPGVPGGNLLTLDDPELGKLDAYVLS